MTTDRIYFGDGKTKHSPGSSQEFIFDAVEIGSLESIEIGHEEVDDSWFIQKVEIEHASQGKLYKFPIESWFSRNHRDGDGQIAKMFSVDVGNFTKIDQKVPVYFTFTTGDTNGAGTDCTVNLMLNHNGKTESYTIDAFDENSEEYRFERGLQTTVSHQIGRDLKSTDLSFAKISLSKSSTRKSACLDWNLEKLEIEYLDGSVTLNANTWLSANGKPYPASATLETGRTKKKTYSVAVKTSNKLGSGTDANVFIEIFGNKGSSGTLALLESQHKDPFEKGQTDNYTFELPDLGSLSRVRVWHDNKGFKSGWHLEKISVDKYDFPCGRWLAKDEEDGSIMRDLKCSNPEYERPISRGELEGVIFT